MSLWLGKPFEGKDFTDSDVCMDWNVDACDIDFSEAKFFSDGDGGIYILTITTKILQLQDNSSIELPAPIQWHLHTKPYNVGFKDKKKEVKPSKCEEVFIKLLTDKGVVDDGKCYSGSLIFTSTEMILNMFLNQPEGAINIAETQEDKLKDKKPMISSGGRGRSYSENSKQKIANKLEFVLAEAKKLDESKSVFEKDRKTLISDNLSKIQN
jgi:hypothetical protein